MSGPRFVGPPCGNYATYTFYRGFRFLKHSKFKTIHLGEFFFVKIYPNYDPCIGEVELLWQNQNSDQLHASVRLYFLPEQTPEGRLPTHGEDEVLVASDKVVLRLDDLVGWITDQVDWNHGLLAYCEDDVKDSNRASLDTSPSQELVTTANNGELNQQKGESAPSQDDDTSAQITEAGAETDLGRPSSVASQDDPPVLKQSENGAEDASEQKKSSSSNDDGTAPAPPAVSQSSPHAKEPATDPQETIDKDELRVIILSYPSYCRYRTIQKRLDGLANEWLKHALVIALGGFTHCGRNTHVLFCRDTFEHEDLAHHELNCEYLAPSLKVKKHKKKGKNARSNSPGSESNTSEDCKEVSVTKQNNGFKQPPCKTEQEFLQRLYKFMKKRKTPIHRVPHLGFKQIDLFVFFSFAQKLGGYDKITGKRLWKHVYDELGGDPGSTSAATCTRRHYEKLLLPFERFMDGKEYKPKQNRKKQKEPKKPKEENGIEPSEKANEEEVNGKVEAEDAYTFTDSNHENSKDSLLANEELNSSEDMQLIQDGFSDEDSKSIWSIQKSADGNEIEKDESKQIKPLIIQKDQNESFSEKERKWNEIRRKNALARKWVRQLRPSRGTKPSSNDKLPMTEGDSNILNQNDLVKDEELLHSDLKKPVPNSSYAGMNNQHVKEYNPTSEAKQNIAKHLHEKLKASASHAANANMNVKDAVLAHHQMREHFSHHIKTEPLNSDTKAWQAYSKKNMYPFTQEKYAPYMQNFDMKLMHNLIKQEYKPMAHTEKDHKNNQSLSSSEHSSSEGKPNISQRRPSVIQHTEYITSSSPSQSPKQLDGPLESISRENMSMFIPSSKTASAIDTQLAYSMAGKVHEWLSKGAHEAIACKTPSASMEKSAELHDKVLIPSSCKTTSAGSNKLPMFVNSKVKVEPYAHYPGSSKAPLPNKPQVSYHQHIPVQDTTKRVSSYSSTNPVKMTSSYQRTFQSNHVPMASTLNSKLDPKYHHQIYVNTATTSRQSSEPFYNQSKRQKTNVSAMPPVVPPRPPSLLPFSRQQMYRTSPLSDIPKTTPSQNDTESVVLDLSVKKPPEKPSVAKSFAPQAMEHSGQDTPLCLDLTVKKKSTVTLRQENAIENITPPLPQSPKTSVHQSSYSSPLSSSSRPMKPLPTLIALQDLIREEAMRQKPSGSTKTSSNTAVSSSQPMTIPLSSLAMSSNAVMFPGNAQCKIPPNFLTALPDSAFAKEMAKSLYMQPDPTQFPPYVIPSFYGASWPAAASSLQSASPSNNSAASPNTFKDSVNHCVFPKQYLYNYKPPFHPILHKDNSYPPNCK